MRCVGGFVLLGALRTEVHHTAHKALAGLHAHGYILSPAASYRARRCQGLPCAFKTRCHACFYSMTAYIAVLCTSPYLASPLLLLLPVSLTKLPSGPYTGIGSIMTPSNNDSSHTGTSPHPPRLALGAADAPCWGAADPPAGARPAAVPGWLGNAPLSVRCRGITSMPLPVLCGVAGRGLGTAWLLGCAGGGMRVVRGGCWG